jgi:hypothetical protein
VSLRTAYLDAEQADLAVQLQHAIRDRSTALVYGAPRRPARVARALLAAETALGRSLTCKREHDRWVIGR